MNNDTNNPATDKAPIPPSAPNMPTVETATANPSAETASIDSSSGNSDTQPKPVVTVSPDVKETRPHTKNPIRAFRYLPRYLKFAVVANVAPILVSAGYLLLFLYVMFGGYVSNTGDPGDMGGLVFFVGMIFAFATLVALGTFVAPLAIALASRKKVAAYISSVIGLTGTGIAAVMFISSLTP